MDEAIAVPVSTGTAPLATPEVIPAAPPAAPVTDAPIAEKPAFERTPRGAVERAMAKLNGDRERDATGKFLPKEGAPPVVADVAKPADTPEAPKPPVAGAEAPPRYSPQAKTDWATTPESVRAEVLRRETEMAAGIEKYRADATAFADLKEFDDLAKSTGTTMKEAMAKYVEFDRLLHKDFISGLDAICQNVGVSMADVARHVVKALDASADGSTPAPAATPQDQTIRALQKELSDLKASVGTVTKTFEEDRNVALLSPHVTAFAAHEDHKRFAELENDIVDILNGKGKVRVSDTIPPLERLSEAYRLADWLKPAPAAPVIAKPATNPDPAAQTRKGSLSVSGAPGNGSDPSSRKPAPSIRDAIRNARSAVG